MKRSGVTVLYFFPKVFAKRRIAEVLHELASREVGLK